MLYVYFPCIVYFSFLILTFNLERAGRRRHTVLIANSERIHPNVFFRDANNFQCVGHTNLYQNKMFRWK